MNRYLFRKNASICCFVVIVLLSPFVVGNVFCADWQSTLESHFDIVDTFDQLQDWRGISGYHDEESLMPKKLDGSPSIWNFYSSDTDGIDDWIKNHGDGYVWQGTKSACVNLKNLGQGVSGDIGYGAGRYSTFFGDGINSKSGYKKIYVFYMIKFRPGYFGKEADGSYAWISVIKHLELQTGFTRNRYWGTPEEHAQACIKPQVTDEYGVNFTVNNIGGGGLSNPHSLMIIENTQCAKFDGCWDYYADHNNAQFRNVNFLTFYEAEEWVGLEYIFDLGDVDTPNGTSEIYLYNKDGVVVAHESKGPQLMRTKIDQLYNKITIGGNMIHEDVDAATSENRFYIDDFIVNGSRIAPTYFSLLQGEFADIKPKNPEATVPQ